METTTAPGGARTVALPGGRTLTVRPATAADVDGLQALYDGLDPEDRRRRFFAAYRPTAAFLRAAATAGERGGVSLVATVDGPGDPEHVVADATCLPLPNGDGEFALTVAAPWRGWVGPYLLDALIEGAAAAGMPNVEADVLLSNGAMLALVRQRGGVVAGHPDGPVVRLLLSTSGDTPGWPPLATGARVLVEGCSRWVGEQAAIDAGMEVVSCTRADRRRSSCPALDGRPCPLALGADVIVMTRPPGVEPWASVARMHAVLHPGATVCTSLPGNGPAALAALQAVVGARRDRSGEGA